MNYSNCCNAPINSDMCLSCFEGTEPFVEDYTDEEQKLGQSIYEKMYRPMGGVWRGVSKSSRTVWYEKARQQLSADT